MSEPNLSELNATYKADAAWSSRNLAIYFVLAYGFSLLLWLPALIRTNRSNWGFALGTFGPTLAAFVTQRIVAGNWRAVRLWSTFSRLIFGFLLGASTILTAALIAACLMTKSGFSRWQWSTLVQIVTLFAPNLLGGPLGEEAGWRGFAVSRLQQRFNPVVSALIVGFFWANWHLPLIWAHAYNVTWWQFFLQTIAASVFLSFGFNCSGGSTICAVLLHGIYNIGTGIILNDLIGQADLRSNAIQHNILWMAYGGVAVLLCFITRGRLAYRACLES